MQPKELEQWIGTQYGVSAEYPWAVSPENAVFRHRENKKWFALLLRVAGDKLGCPGTAPVWILNVKCDPLMIGSLCSMEGIYPAYHMNKTHWISIAMDDRVPRVLVQDLLDQSYASTASAPRRQKSGKRNAFATEFGAQVRQDPGTDFAAPECAAGAIPIPKSKNPARLAENIAVFDFAPEGENMAALGGMNQNRRTGHDPLTFDF